MTEAMSPPATKESGIRAMQARLVQRMAQAMPQTGLLCMPLIAAGRIWLLPADAVRRVLIPGRLTRICNAKLPIAGLASSAGVVYTVFDFGFQIAGLPGALSSRSRFVCLETEREGIALQVDRVLDLIPLPSVDMAAPPPEDLPLAAHTVDIQLPGDTTPSPAFLINLAALLCNCGLTACSDLGGHDEA